MRWPEIPPERESEAERLLREGLDRARARTGDELALRRVWSRVGEPDLLAPARPRRWGLAIGSLGMTVAGAIALAALTGDLGRGRPRGEPLASAPPPAPAPVSAPAQPPGEPELLGPAIVKTGARQRRTVVLKGRARASLDTQTVLAIDAGHRPVLRQGRVGLEVPRQAPGERFSVEAGPYTIVVVGTRFDVDMTRGGVAVRVDEGVVEVWRGDEMTRVSAGQSWNGRVETAAARPQARARRRSAPASRRVASAAPASGGGMAPIVSAPIEVGPAPPVTTAPTPAVAAPPPPAPAPPPEPRPSDLFQQAKAAAAGGDPDRALELLEGLSKLNGPVGENAAYEMGRLYKEQLLRPRKALDAFRRYRDRFPQGLLRMEADISIIEALVNLDERAEALTEAEAFLRRHPHSERRVEVSRTVARLRGGPVPGTPGGAPAR